MSPPLILLSYVMTMLGLFSIGAWSWSTYQTLHDPAFGGRNLDTDFSVFWAAAQLALEGDWLAPFDSAILNERRLIPEGRESFEMLWFYPPSYLALIMPLGALPYFWSWAAWGAVSLAALAIALRRPARDIPGSLCLIVFAPAALMVLALGQNSLLIAALLIGALEAMRRDEHLLAGLLIAAMTIKPQLGLAIPIVLLAGGYWRVILWACIGTVAIIGLTLIHPGPDYWVAFFQGLAENGDRIRETDLMRLMISTFGNAVHFGMGHGWAMILQITVSAATALALAWIWRSPHASFDLKAASLCLAVILITPYAIHYELIFGAVAAFYLGRDRAAATVPGRYLMVVIWLMPAIGYVLLVMPGFGIASPILVLTMLFCAARARTGPPPLPVGHTR